LKRSFDRVSIDNGGIKRPGYKIVCVTCGANDTIIASGHSGSLPPEAIIQKFSQKGWAVGGAPNHDVCPACIRERNMARKGNVVAITKPLAEKPREMSREDKRLIFGKIDTVYLDESRGYESGWSDKRIADDLGVPLIWVRGIRESDFGPEGLAADSREIIAEAKRLGEELVSLDKRFTELAKELSDIKSRYARTERSVDDVRKLTVA
jgi:hypothetical protein